MLSLNIANNAPLFKPVEDFSSAGIIFLPTYYGFSVLPVQYKVRTGNFSPRNGGTQMTDGQKTLIDKLRLEGYGYLKVAKKIGVSENTVKSYCRRNKTNSKAQENIAVCEQCGESIDISKRSSRRFCSDACRNKWWNEHPKAEMSYSISCACCGKKIHMRRRNEKKYCSHACYIKTRYEGGGGNE